MPVVYQELHRIAASCLQGQGSHTLQPTALIHEAYLRLAGRAAAELSGRRHFYVLAATIMRQILVDHARAHLREKRGGGAHRIAFEEAFVYTDDRPAQLVALDDALTTLAQFDQRKSRILELRFFAGLSVEETSEALGISIATTGRESRLAQAWLLSELSS